MSDSAQLLWQCRRGTRELDILLRGFLDERFAELSSEQQKVFRRLLDMQDPVLIEWFWGQSQPPEEFDLLIARIREHASTAHSTKN